MGPRSVSGAVVFGTAVALGGVSCFSLAFPIDDPEPLPGTDAGSDAAPDASPDAEPDVKPPTCACNPGAKDVCAAYLGAAAADAGCVAPVAAAHDGGVLACKDGVWQLRTDCKQGCVSGKKFDWAACATTDPCPCSIGPGEYCGNVAAMEAAKYSCEIPATIGHDGDLLYCTCPGGIGMCDETTGPGTWEVDDVCSNGCTQSMTNGDSCTPERDGGA